MKNYVRLATGTKVNADFGAPTAQDMAQTLGRIPRFCGGTRLWYPVMLHSFVVADLLPHPLKFHGLTHDGVEVIGGDVPAPVKNPITKEMEVRINARFLEAEGVEPLDADDYALLKKADIAAAVAEIWTVGSEWHREENAEYERVPEVEELVLHYYNLYPLETLIDQNGPAANTFLSRFRRYKALTRLVAP